MCHSKHQHFRYNFAVRLKKRDIGRRKNAITAMDDYNRTVRYRRNLCEGRLQPFDVISSNCIELVVFNSRGTRGDGFPKDPLLHVTLFGPFFFFLPIVPYFPYGHIYIYIYIYIYIHKRNILLCCDDGYEWAWHPSCDVQGGPMYHCF